MEPSPLLVDGDAAGWAAVADGLLMADVDSGVADLLNVLATGTAEGACATGDCVDVVAGTTGCAVAIDEAGGCCDGCCAAGAACEGEEAAGAEVASDGGDCPGCRYMVVVR